MACTLHIYLVTLHKQCSPVARFNTKQFIKHTPRPAISLTVSQIISLSRQNGLISFTFTFIETFFLRIWYKHHNCISVATVGISIRVPLSIISWPRKISLISRFTLDSDRGCCIRIGRKINLHDEFLEKKKVFCLAIYTAELEFIVNNKERYCYLCCSISQTLFLLIAIQQLGNVDTSYLKMCSTVHSCN